MKISAKPTASLLRAALVLLLLATGDGCRRRAKSTTPTEGSGSAAVESTAVIAGDTPRTAQRTNIPPAPPITNNVVPPPRVDPATGKLILHTDGVILKQRTKAE